MKLLTAILLSTSILISGCGVQGTQGGTKAAENSSFFGGRHDDVTVNETKAFSGKNQVVIGGFKVAFLEGKKAGKKAGGGLTGSGIGGKSSAKMTLTGVDGATEQQITDAAYADFLAQMKKAGYNVIERDGLLANAKFKDAKSQTSPQREEAAFFGSSVTANYYAPSSIGKLYSYGDAPKSSGFNFTMPDFSAMDYASSSSIPVLFVTYTIDFANADGHGGTWTSTSSLTVGQGISVASGGGIHLVGGAASSFSNPNGSVILGQPVSSDETFGEVVDQSSDAYKGAEVALNVVGSVLGAGSNISREYEIKADGAKYKKITEKLLKEANGKLVSKMATLK